LACTLSVASFPAFRGFKKADPDALIHYGAELQKHASMMPIPGPETGLPCVEGKNRYPGVKKKGVEEEDEENKEVTEGLIMPLEIALRNKKVFTTPHATVVMVSVRRSAATSRS
jgi:hypothetical protein